MASPLIAPGGLSDVEGKVADSLRQIADPLQTHFGGRTGLGKWVRYSLADILLGTGTVGSFLTATRASGQLCYAIIGDTMWVSLNAVALTLSVAANILLMQLPDGWEYYPRQNIYPTDSTLSLETAPLLTVDGVGQSIGLMQVRTLMPPGPSSLRIIRDNAAGNFAAGNIVLRGQLTFEVRQIGER